MSATQDLIAAALRLAALAERNTDCRDEWQEAIDSVREACARAMVQPVGDVPEADFGNMLDCRTCAHFTADGCNSTVMCMEADQYKATGPRRYWATMSGKVKP